MRFSRNFIVGCAMFFAIVPFSSAKDDFKMLFHVSNLGAPDFTKLGFDKSYIVYEQYLYNKRDSRKEPIKEWRIQKEVKRITTALPPGSFVQLDIEGWHGKSENELIWLRKQYRSTIERVQKYLPDYLVGYYRIAPVWAHWDMHKNDRLRVEWNIENTKRQAIANLSDVLYPALYTYHKDPKKWQWTAEKILHKAKELANGKPVIPFLWPKFHPSSDVGGKGKRLIPKAYWRLQLETVLKHADGFILWNDGRTRLWSDTFPWWQATHEFLLENFPERIQIEELKSKAVKESSADGSL